MNLAVRVRAEGQIPDYAGVDLKPMARSTDERPRTAYLASGRLDQAVAEARKGDAAAFRLLYQEFQPLLLRYLRFLVGDRADDVADQAWQRAVSGLSARPGAGWRNRDIRRWDLGLRREGLGARAGYRDFRGWIAGLARAIARDERARSEPPQRDRGSDGRGGPDCGEDATGAALRLIAELPADEAEAVLLRSVLGLDARRAARVCGQRPRALRAAAHRGLSTLAGRV